MNEQAGDIPAGLIGLLHQIPERALRLARHIKGNWPGEVLSPDCPIQVGYTESEPWCHSCSENEVAWLLADLVENAALGLNLHTHLVGMVRPRPILHGHPGWHNAPDAIEVDEAHVVALRRFQEMQASLEIPDDGRDHTDRGNEDGA